MTNHSAFTKGRTAVITGGASGIGFATAKAAAKAGMVPVVIDLPGENLDRAAEVLDDLAENFLMLAADVADDGELFAAAEHVAANLPPVTFLMNNAGIGPASTALASTPGLGNDIIDVNLLGRDPWRAGLCAGDDRAWRARHHCQIPAPSRASPRRRAIRPITSPRRG